MNKLKYNYQNLPNGLSLTAKQLKEIMRRDKAFAEGKTSARPWDEIKKELENVYR